MHYSRGWPQIQRNFVTFLTRLVPLYNASLQSYGRFEFFFSSKNIRKNKKIKKEGEKKKMITLFDTNLTATAIVIVVTLDK